MRVILFAVVAFGSLISLEAHDNRSNGSNTIRVDEALIVFLVGSAFCALVPLKGPDNTFKLLFQFTGSTLCRLRWELVIGLRAHQPIEAVSWDNQLLIVQGEC